MSLNKHICYDARSDAVVWWIVILSLNVIDLDLGLSRQGAVPKGSTLLH